MSAMDSRGVELGTCDSIFRGHKPHGKAQNCINWKPLAAPIPDEGAPPEEIHTKFIDPDYRKNPKTEEFCVRCQKDLKPGQTHRWVHLMEDACITKAVQHWLSAQKEAQ